MQHAAWSMRHAVDRQVWIYHCLLYSTETVDKVAVFFESRESFHRDPDPTWSDLNSNVPPLHHCYAHGSVEVDPIIQVGLTTTPSLLGIRVSVEAGKAAHTAIAIAHPLRSKDDGYIFCTSGANLDTERKAVRCFFRRP